MTRTKSLISLTVVIPSKNRPSFLKDAVLSVLSAVYDTEIEVIIVDDRSNPPMSEILNIEDPRVRIVVSDASPGAAGARNFGVARAKGTRILFLDDDDLMRPGYPDWVIAQNAEYGHSPVFRFSGNDRPKMFPFVEGRPIFIESLRPLSRQIAGLGCGFWIDRDAFFKVGNIAEDIRVNEDTEFCIRLLKRNFVGLKAPDAGVMVRNHSGSDGQMSHLTAAATAMERAAYFADIIDRHDKWLATRRDAAFFLLQRQLRMLARAGETRHAISVIQHQLGQGIRVKLAFSYGLSWLAERLRPKN